MCRARQVNRWRYFSVTGLSLTKLVLPIPVWAVKTQHRIWSIVWKISAKASRESKDRTLSPSLSMERMPGRTTIMMVKNFSMLSTQNWLPVKPWKQSLPLNIWRSIPSSVNCQNFSRVPGSVPIMTHGSANRKKLMPGICWEKYVKTWNNTKLFHPMPPLSSWQKPMTLCIWQKAQTGSGGMALTRIQAMIIILTKATVHSWKGFTPLWALSIQSYWISPSFKPNHSNLKLLWVAQQLQCLMALWLKKSGLLPLFIRVLKVLLYRLFFMVWTRRISIYVLTLPSHWVQTILLKFTWMLRVMKTSKWALWRWRHWLRLLPEWSKSSLAKLLRVSTWVMEQAGFPRMRRSDSWLLPAIQSDSLLPNPFWAKLILALSYPRRWFSTALFKSALLLRLVFSILALNRSLHC